MAFAASSVVLAALLSSHKDAVASEPSDDGLVGGADVQLLPLSFTIWFPSDSDVVVDSLS